MLPPKTFKNLVFVTNLAWLVGSVPYHFLRNPMTRDMNLVASFTRFRVIYVHGTFFILIAYINYLILRLLHTIFTDEDYTTQFVVQMCYQIFGYTQIAVIHFTTVQRLREIPQFLICSQRLLRTIKERYILPGEWGPKCLKFFYAWYIVGFIVNSQNCILIVKKPYRPHYLTSLLVDPVKTPILHRIPFMLVHLVVWSSGWMQVLTMCFHLYSYISSLVWVLREMDINVRFPKTRSALREPKNFTAEIRSLQVLHGMWLHANQPFLCPAHKLVAIIVATLGTYGVIKLTGPVSIMMGAMAMISTLYIYTLFTMFGNLFMVSQKTIENWNSAKSSKWLKKFVKSVPVFCIRVGFFYRVERMTVFTALSTIVNNTITLLFI